MARTRNQPDSVLISETSWASLPSNAVALGDRPSMRSGVCDFACLARHGLDNWGPREGIFISTPTSDFLLPPHPAVH